ncbi:ABC transporter permease [Endozoicomonas sp. OPT23]|nr:ABC transporter permease [Endozoicomonas sp. OPT23]
MNELMSDSVSLMKQHAATLVAVLFLAPVVVGVSGAFLPAFGYIPELGHHEFSLNAWRHLIETPGLAKMLALTLTSGVGATLLSLILAFSFVSAAWNKRWWRQAERWLSPILAAPHVAYAVGFSFLIMPGGMLARMLASLTGWTSPPGWETVQDPAGISLMLILALKEAPFLVLMLMAAVNQIPVNDSLRTGLALGYQPWMVWVKIIWPQLYKRIRFSLLTVLVFSLSVVDIAIVMGPSTPPTFAVQVLNWFRNPDLDFQSLASAGSLLLMLIVLTAISVLYLVEKGAGHISGWLTNGHRGRLGEVWNRIAVLSWKVTVISFAGSVLMLLVWSFAWRWRFPSLSPEKWSFRSWERAWPQLSEPLWNSLIIGLVSAALGVVIAILLLEAGKRTNKLLSRLMYLPLLLPQLTFLFGIQVWMIRLDVEGYWFSVVFMHLLFVLPYCYLSLSGPWRYYDDRHSKQAWLLSGSRVKAFVQVKSRVLLKPVLASFALGFAVSIAQYLPTVFAGAGRVTTVTTETVALAASGNRRLIGVYALVQMLLPLLIYALFTFMGRWQLREWKLSRRFI